MYNLLFEIVVNQTFLIDVFGIIGLGLVAFGAIRLASRFGSVNARMMTWGALVLIVGRIAAMAYGAFMTPQVYASASDGMLLLAQNVPVLLLTLGMGLIVAGFWAHERDLSEEAEAAGLQS